VKRLKKIIVIGGALLILLVSTGMTFTIGWRPLLGPRARPLTDRKFESNPVRLQRGEYLVHAVAGCFSCHSQADDTLPGLPPKVGREGAGQLAEPIRWATSTSQTSRRTRNQVLATGRMTRSRAPYGKVSVVTVRRCFPSCRMTISDSCPMRTSPP
jgi:hypothetical protein